ncbi:hypothetical protein CH289_17300 [Rhodococcus sp. RS1C4]|nr:hypothetical protein [Rhodococcus sp. RS1C4]OZC49294.1 hypothetical protein CH289_17300 [Rhodococcus sp. RS1C4]
MASDFEYTGEQNGRAGFRDATTGMSYWLDIQNQDQLQLMDGDELVVPMDGKGAVWSIRENRIVRWDYNFRSG